MEIVEYSSKYDDNIKDLLVELQNYLIDIDNWHTQVLLPNYRNDIFEQDLSKVQNNNGKIYLVLENDKIIGLIIGIVATPDEEDKLTNDCAKTGIVLELIVNQKYQSKGIGRILLSTLEDYFRNINCKRINIEVFGPNKSALNFYSNNGYIIRDYIVSKQIKPH